MTEFTPDRIVQPASEEEATRRERMAAAESARTAELAARYSQQRGDARQDADALGAFLEHDAADVMGGPSLADVVAADPTLAPDLTPAQQFAAAVASLDNTL